MSTKSSFFGSNTTVYTETNPAPTTAPASGTLTPSPSSFFGGGVVESAPTFEVWISDQVALAASYAQSAAAAADTEITNRAVRVDTAQALTSGQKTQAATNLGLSTVAISGNYADLLGKPTLFSGAYADLTGKPVLFSGAYADLTGKPTLFSGAYADLTGKPVLATVATSGSYSDLTGKPTLGGAASLNVGTTTGTVAAGDDSRFTGTSRYSLTATNSATDQTTAIQALLTAGGDVLLGPGTFKTSAALTIPPGTVLRGCGPGVTIINQTGAADIIDALYTTRSFNSQGGIRDMSLMGTNTCPHAIDVQYANAGFFLFNLWIGPAGGDGTHGPAIGIRYRDSWYTQNSHLTIVASGTAGILFDVGTGGGVSTGNGGYAGTGYFSNISILATTSPGTGIDSVPPTAGLLGNGVYLKQDGGSLWSQVEIWGTTGAAFRIEPPTGKLVANQWFYGCVGDTAVQTALDGSANGWAFTNGSGGTVQSMFLSGCWGSYNQNCGLVAIGVDGLYIQGGIFELNVYNGIVITASKNFRINNCNVWSNSFAVPGSLHTPTAGENPGILIANTAACSQFNIESNTIGNNLTINSTATQGAPISIGAFANNFYIIVNNNCVTSYPSTAIVDTTTTVSPSRINTPNLA